MQINVRNKRQIFTPHYSSEKKYLQRGKISRVEILTLEFLDAQTCRLFSVFLLWVNIQENNEDSKCTTQGWWKRSNNSKRFEVPYWTVGAVYAPCGKYWNELVITWNWEQSTAFCVLLFRSIRGWVCGVNERVLFGKLLNWWKIPIQRVPPHASIHFAGRPPSLPASHDISQHNTIYFSIPSHPAFFFHCPVWPCNA